mmetsp:Transcript_31449/g.83326  ORF Transcript_31449/g.83326 Transcript_31449/m.83326 type:complete len:234 (-) Transcript_31449:67-768(-)
MSGPTWDGARVLSSIIRGRRMATLPPRRSRMLRVSVGKRGWGKMTSSETKSDSAAGPPASSGGSQKSGVPKRGMKVTVGAISPGCRAPSSRDRRVRMFDSMSSTPSRPLIGLPGVDSIIHLPNSGIQFAVSPQPGLRHSSASCSSARTSGERSATLTVRPASSGPSATSRKMPCSTSSPQRKGSPSMCWHWEKTLRNCSRPCSRTKRSCSMACCHVMGSLSCRNPMAPNQRGN